MATKVEEEIRKAVAYLGADGTLQDVAVQKALEHLHAALEALKLPVDHRRRLPDERNSFTHKFVIAGHDFYATVGLYDDGTPGELFLKAAKEGSTLAGLLDTVGVLFSLGLQYGVPLAAIVTKLTNTRFEPAGITETEAIRFAKSPADYLARWLRLKYLPPDAAEAPGPSPLVSDPPPPAEPKGGLDGTVTGSDGPPCSKCGSIMQKMGSRDCWICPNCQETSGSCGG